MFRLKVIDCRSKFHSSVSFFKPLCNKNQEKLYADDSINCKETIAIDKNFFFWLLVLKFCLIKFLEDKTFNYKKTIFSPNTPNEEINILKSTLS